MSDADRTARIKLRRTTLVSDRLGLIEQVANIDNARFSAELPGLDFVGIR